MSGNTAWVTLATNDTYCLGALVLANSLKRVNTVHQLAVLITPGVSQPMRQQLAKVFNVVKEVDVLDSGDEANLALIARPELGVTFTKLHCWNLTQFSKCVFLDADVLVIQNCDELFEREELSAAPDVGWPDCFNSGVFVFVPSKDTFKALIDCALSQGSFDGGDQGLLNIFFKDWPTKDIKKHLPFIYNMVSTASYSYLPAFKLFGSQVKIVHFIGSNKPWLQSGSAATSTLSGFLQTWWSIFNSHVSQTLSTEMAGLAGALAGGERAAIEDVWRRQNWEQGVIDYMGRDSFDNIWKKISESIGSKAAVPATAPVATAASTEAGEKSSAPAAATAETKETPSQQDAKEPTDSVVPPPVKVEQSEGAPVAAEQQAADKTATPLEKKDEVLKTEITQSVPTKEDASSKTEKVDVTEQAKVSPSTDAEAPKEKAQDLPKSDSSTTPAKPVQPSEITPQKEGEQPKTEAPIQSLPAVPLPPPEAKTEPLTDTKPPQEAKSDVVPTETKCTEQKTPTDKAGKEVVEAAVSKQEVPKAEATPPTPTECSKPDTTQLVKEAKSAEEKTDKPEAKESVPSDVHKTEEVKTPPVEVKTTQEAPKEPLATTEKPAKDDSAPKEHSSTGAAPKETPASTEAAVKEDSAPKVPSSPEIPKEAPACPKTPAKDDSMPKVPSSSAAPSETAAPPALTETPATPTSTPATPTITPATPTITPATPTSTPAAPTSTPATPTSTPATPTSTPASAEKPVKDDAASKVPSSPTAPKELPAGAEQPKKDDSAPKAPSSTAESKEPPKKDDSAPKVPTEPSALSKDVAPTSGAPAEVPPPATTPSGPEVSSEAKPAAESKKSPSTPQPSPAEGASAAIAAPVPPKRKGNKEQKSGNGGKQSKSKK